MCNFFYRAHCRFYISGLSCYCLTNLIILRHSLLRRIILVCYYFYFLSDLFVRETQKKYFVRREIFFYFFYGTCVFPSLFFEEKKNYKSFCLHCMIFMCYYVYYFGKNLQIIIFIMFWLLKTVICTIHFFVIFRRLVRKFVIKM